MYFAFSFQLSMKLVWVKSESGYVKKTFIAEKRKLVVAAISQFNVTCEIGGMAAIYNFGGSINSLFVFSGFV